MQTHLEWIMSLENLRHFCLDYGGTKQLIYNDEVRSSEGKTSLVFSERFCLFPRLVHNPQRYFVGFGIGNADNFLC